LLSGWEKPQGQERTLKRQGDIANFINARAACIAATLLQDTAQRRLVARRLVG
jgi:hypothetical protein